MNAPKPVLIEHYETLEMTIALDSPARWQDARNLKKLIGLEAAPPPLER